MIGIVPECRSACPGIRTIKAINEVGLYQYVEKPWDNNELKLIIQNGLERRFLMEKLEQKISEVQQVQRNLQDIQAQIIKAFM